ncbi:MAG: hypothetical protein HQK51_21095, partial [Oligoflexia bacterium]|nr:hypothetical protein [Oligoflexia bacterium]
VCWLVIFNPTIIELLLAILVDVLSLAIYLLLENKFDLFSRIFKQYIKIFPVINISDFAKDSFETRSKKVISILQFPLIRSIYIYIVSYIKIIPCAVVIIFYWHHPQSDTNLMRGLKIFAIEACILSYFASIVYTSLCNDVSKTLKMLHEILDLTKEMHLVPRPNKREGLFNIELLAISSIIFNMIFLSYLFLLEENISNSTLYFKLIIIFVTTIIMIARVYQLNRTYFMLALSDIFSKFYDLKSKKRSIISLHPLSTLMEFQQLYNNLVKELDYKEHEIEKWITYELEDSRYKMLGELAGIVAHDLSGPLHTIGFCAEELKSISFNRHEYYNRFELDQFFHYIDINVKQANNLLETLKAQIKNPSESIESSDVSECYTYTLQLLKTQFSLEEIVSLIIDAFKFFFKTA